MQNIAYKFVKWEVPELETLQNSEIYKLAKKWESKKPLTREEKNKITYFANNNNKLQGWLFPFYGLNKFDVKQWDSIQEYKGIDKTAVRSLLTGKVQRITII